MRRRGVFGYNLPPQVGNVVSPANFSNIGVIGRFVRGLVDRIQVNQVGELNVKVGGYKSGFYGRYVLDTMFTNLKGVGARIFIKMFVASDAVQASKTIVDQAGSPATAVTVGAAYANIVDKSADGNNTGYTVTPGARFSTTCSAGTTGDTFLTLASVSGIRVGSVLKISSASVQWRKVTAIDENTKRVTFVALSSDVADAVVVEDWGFKITCYRKNARGVASKVSLPENNIWLSLEAENTEFYVNNAFVNHPYIKLTIGTPSSTLATRYPIAITTPVFLESGSDGTSPSVTSDWNLYSAFDDAPVRWLLNTDTTLSGVNLAGEAYCGARLDTPVWVQCTAKEQTKAQLITAGQAFQRSDQVQALTFASFRAVSDPIGVGANPTLDIPVHGAIVGAWVRAIFTLGIHRVPAGDDVPISGFVATPNATEDAFTEDDRTEILEAGVNLVQQLPGRGLLVRSFRTLSTNLGALFGHYLILQNFIKVSSVESLYRAENRPNRLSALKEYGQAISDFGQKLYNGSFPFGIDRDGAFGEFTKDDGSLSTFEDVFIVQADQFNNVPSQIAIGDGDIAVRFFPASLLESLAIGVGVTIPL